MAWIVSLKIMLISSGVVFMALAMKVSVPLVLEFVASHLPLMWSSFLSWLRPPYLYVIINGIIITIVASSRFHLNRPETPSSPPKVSEYLGYEAKVPSEFDILEQPEVYELREEKPSPSVYELMSEEKAMVEYEERDQEVTVDVKTAVVNGTAEAEDEEDEEFVISRSEWKPLTRSDSSEILSSVERPPVSARFGHRKLLKSSPEGGRALRVSKPKRHETLESTWKAITEGRSMPLSRHMKKCDTWENHGSQIDLGQVDQSPVKKSETFKDRTNHQQALALTSLPISGKLRKEPSLSQDELNRRVEAFINKFNEEMRLQRQESLNQYTEMINRGSH